MDKANEDNLHPIENINNGNNSEKWYGCIVLNEENEPILFPLSRNGEMMDGAGIEDPEEAYSDLGKEGVAIIQCQFKKDGVVISPEEASQEHSYDDLEFNTLVLAKATVDGLLGRVDNIWAMYKESSEKFQEMLSTCMEDVVERENTEKKYLAFSVYEAETETQSMYVMNKLGKIYPKFKFKGGKTESQDNLDEGSIYEIQFQDGTLPITIKEANGRMSTDAENIFLRAELIGAVKLKEDYEFKTWEEAIAQDYETMEPLMKHSMFALKENNDRIKSEKSEKE